MTSSLLREIANLIAECVVETRPKASLTWAEFKEWLINSRLADKQAVADFSAVLRGAGGFVRVRDAFMPPAPTVSEQDRFEAGEKAKSNRKIVKEAVSERSFSEKFLGELSGLLPAIKVESSGFARKKGPEKTERIVTLFLSDLHIGANQKASDTGSTFGRVEAARRLASVIQETADYKLDHRKETTLHLILGGDLIQGALGHNDTAERLALQWAMALNYLLQSIVKLSSVYPKIKVFCTPGNHDRNVSVSPSRAIHNKVADSYSTMLHSAIKDTAKLHLKNVEVIIPETAWIEIPYFNERAYVTHGDTNLDTGQPGQNVKIGALVNQMNRINIGEVSRGLKPFRLFMAGHVHVGALIQIPGGYHLMINPALNPKDAYGLQFGHGQACGQTLFESVADHIVGDYRLIEVNSKTDSDESLDKIIEPFEGL